MHMQDEDEPPNWLRPPRAWPSISDYSLEGLGIDVEGAKIDPTRLLPVQISLYHANKYYPLPKDRADLEILAALPIESGRGTKEACYLRRVRHNLKNFDVNRKVKAVKYDRSRLVMKEVRAIVKAREQANEELAKVQQAVSVVRSTMLETSQEFDTGFGMIARAFNRNETLPNGETVSVKSLISAYKNFYDHMHKLGGPITDDMAEEAEEAVFAKAMEASRERIQRTLRTAIPIQATRVDDHAAVAANSTPKVEAGGVEEEVVVGA